MLGKVIPEIATRHYIYDEVQVFSILERKVHVDKESNLCVRLRALTGGSAV